MSRLRKAGAPKRYSKTALRETWKALLTERALGYGRGESDFRRRAARRLGVPPVVLNNLIWNNPLWTVPLSDGRCFDADDGVA